MERQDFDAADVWPLLDDLRHGLDVLLRIRQPGHEHEPNPRFDAALGQTIAEIDRRLEVAARDFLVQLGNSGLDVQEHEIDVVEHRLCDISSEEARRIDARVNSEFLRPLQKLRDETRLHHRLAAGDRDSPAGGVEGLPVAFDPPEEVVDFHGLAVAHLEGVGVVAVETPQPASGQENRHADARTVDGGHELPGMERAEGSLPHPAQPVGMLQIRHLDQTGCAVSLNAGRRGQKVLVPGGVRNQRVQNGLTCRHGTCARARQAAARASSGRS